MLKLIHILQMGSLGNTPPEGGERVTSRDTRRVEDQILESNSKRQLTGHTSAGVLACLSNYMVSQSCRKARSLQSLT